MDKYEYKLKLDQLKNLVNEGDYETAGQIVDSINWRKVRNSATLCMVGDVYQELGRYDESKEIYLLAYDHAPIGRNIVYKLTEAAIKSNSVAEAEEYYNEFAEIAGNDTKKYVLRYKLSTLKNEPIQNRISILEELKEKEYTEEWAYELANLYQKAGRTRECIDVCDELELWFGDGEYVEKALELKMGIEPLTPNQDKKYRKFMKEKEEAAIAAAIPVVEAVAEVADASPEISTKAANTVKYNTVNLQEELKKSMQQIMDAKEADQVSDTMESIKKLVEDIPQLNTEEPKEKLDDTQVFDKLGCAGELNAQAILAKAVAEEFAMEEPVAIIDPAALFAEEQQVEEPEPEFVEEILEPEEEAEAADEVELLEKQITGQMSIEDIMAEWEKTKQETEEAIAVAEQKYLDDTKAKAMQETQDMIDKLTAMSAAAEATEEVEEPAEEEALEEIIEENTDDADDFLQSVLDDAQKILLDEIEKISSATTGAEDMISESEVKAEEAEAVVEVPEVETVMEAPEVEAVMEVPEVEEVPVSQANVSDADIDAQLIMPDITGMMEAEEEETVKEEAPAMEEPVAAEPVIVAPVVEKPQVAVVDPAELFAEEKQPFVEEVPLPNDIMAEMNQMETNAKEVVLTKEQRALFPYFLPVPGMEQQICQTLSECLTKKKTITSLTGNIIIQGPDGSGKTVLAASLIKALQMMTPEAEGRTGKISATALNKKDFTTLLPKLQGGYLIIEKAGNLLPETMMKISQAMEGNTQGLVVIMEDSISRIRAILEKCPAYASKFTSKITIPVFTIDELVDFGKSYAREMECTIDEMGILALYNRISNIQKHDKATSLTEVREIVDQAIESAESGGGIKKTFGSFFAKRYNDNDFLILHEKDFEV